MSDTPTYGEIAVGFDFNPGGNTKVSHVKRQYADIIDDLHDGLLESSDELQKHEFEQAIDHAKIAQMLAVKAITRKKA